MEDRILFKEESYKIIGAAREVHKVLGCGFTEPVYQEALELEFQLRDIPYVREKNFQITYKGQLLDKEFESLPNGLRSAYQLRQKVLGI